MFPASDELRDVMSSVVTPFGADPYKELNLSGRYWSPVPRFPEETFGLGVNRWLNEDLAGETGLTYLDDKSALSNLTGVPLPDPMALKPGLELARGRPLEALQEFLPSYVKKLGRDKLYGEEIGKRDLVNQAIFGLRTIPQTHRKAAMDRGDQPLKKLRGTANFKKASTSERMAMEGNALRIASRDTLF
jgi:hypothetical protein